MRTSTLLFLALAAATLASPVHAANSRHARPQPFATADWKPSVPFIEDDFDKALALAQSKGVPLVIEGWAPWCHTCRSMRAFTWTDPALAKHAKRFVWLSLDMEKASNAPARKRIGISAFPTLYVLDPKDGQVAIRWLGSANVAQLEKLFDDGELSVKGGAKGPALEALIAADRAYGSQKYGPACDGYRHALMAGGPSWPGYNRAAESYMFASSQADSNESTLLVADQVWSHVKGTVSSAVVAGTALDAAVELDNHHPRRDEWLKRYEAAAREVLSNTALPIATDDRSGLYFSLESAREAVEDSAGVRALEEEHVAMLEGMARKATTPDQRFVFDAHRLSLYMALGRAQDAIPMLEQSQKDFPQDYNPPQRLATAYKALGRWTEALAASDRALELAYGPRQFLVLTTRAEIQLGMGQKDAAVQTLMGALKKAQAMPDGQHSDATVSGLLKRLAALGAKVEG